MKSENLHNKSQSILFDLDGTLLDSAPDMYRALELLCEHEKAVIPDYLAAQNRISRGVAGLFELTFELTPDDPQFNPLRDRYLDYYTQVLGDKSRLFAGLASCVEFLEQSQVPWGIVTSKAYRFAHPLVEQIDALNKNHCLIAGDTVTPSKPHPAPLFEACRRLNVDPTRCIYVGDAETDIAAGRAAGMKTIIAGWGYIGEQLQPSSWMADHQVASSNQLIELLRSLFK